MKTKVVILVKFLFIQFCLGQQLLKNLLQCIAVNDSVKGERGSKICTFLINRIFNQQKQGIQNIRYI